MPTGNMRSRIIELITVLFPLLVLKRVDRVSSLRSRSFTNQPSREHDFHVITRDDRSYSTDFAFQLLNIVVPIATDEILIEADHFYTNDEQEISCRCSLSLDSRTSEIRARVVDKRTKTSVDIRYCGFRVRKQFQWRLRVCIDIIGREHSNGDSNYVRVILC